MRIYLEPLERFGKTVFLECCRCSVRRVEPWAEAEVAVPAELLTRTEQKKRRIDSAQR
jgi:hypothetical protein